MTKKIPQNVYNILRKNAPFCNIDIIIKKDNQFLLGKRIIKPYKNTWSLPGGRVRRGERITTAITRIAKEECSCKVGKAKFVTFYEGITKYRHDIGLVFTAPYLKGNLKNDTQHSKLQWFRYAPKKTVSFHKKALKPANKK